MFLSKSLLFLLSIPLTTLAATGTSQIPVLRNLRSPRPITALASPQRQKTCLVDSHGDLTKDDSEYVLAAFEECNNGGHVIFLQQSEYIIGSPLNLSKLSHVDIDIQGGITFTNDIEFWQANAFQFDFQDARSFFLLGGEDVNVYGGGTLEGNGQLWWDMFYTNKTIKRPVLFATVGLHGGSISDLSLNNSPFCKIHVNHTHRWLRELYWKVPAFGETTEFKHIRNHYTKSHKQINQFSITPVGPVPYILPLDEEVPAVRAARK